MFNVPVRGPASKPLNIKAGFVPPQTPAPAPYLAPDYGSPSDPDESNPLRRLGFRFALALVFFHFGFIHELLSYGLGVANTYVLLLINLTSIILAVATRGIRRTLVRHPARWWIAFTGWFVLATVFSTYRAGSIHLLQGYLLNMLSIVLVVAGLTLTLKECFQMMSAVALGGLVNVLSGSLFRNAEDGRFSIDFGSIANSNDFAAHLLFVMPFVLFVLITKRAKFVRFVAAGTILYSLYLVATTGSRGALISFAVVTLFLISRASGPVRLVSLLGVPLLVVALAALLPQSIVSRYGTLFQADGQKTEADESAEVRQYLLTTSVRVTLENPLFGVGPGEFADAEGFAARAKGQHGVWLVSHNAYTQVSSELGIPGILFYLGALISTFRLIASIRKKCRNITRLHESSIAAFCMMLAMVGFGVAIVFLSLAYTFYFLFMSGLAIALANAVDREITVEQQAKSVRVPRTRAILAYPGA